MGIFFGQRKRTSPLSLQLKLGWELVLLDLWLLLDQVASPLDLALNMQKSFKSSPMALDITQASQFSSGKFLTPQLKVPKPVPVGTISEF